MPPTILIAVLAVAVPLASGPAASTDAPHAPATTASNPSSLPLPPSAAPPIRFLDATADLGLAGADNLGINAARLCFADLNADGRPDVMIRTAEKYRIFLHTLDAAKPCGFFYSEVLAETNLPKPAGGDSLVFADIDNDSLADAILTRSLDINNEKYSPPTDQPTESAWLKGNGDGTFGLVHPLGSKKATTACIAVGDVDRDGRLDLYLGNWYTSYGKSNEAFINDLLIQSHDRARVGAFDRVKLPEDDAKFSEEKDEAGRPTYGVMIAQLFDSLVAGVHGAPNRPQLLELSYGRRANRVWRQLTPQDPAPPAPLWAEVADQVGLAGDGNRDGKYPDWVKTDARLARPDELPYRSHGNTFDASIGDINNDGLFDLFEVNITHAWAGDCSDRSRFLVQHSGFAGPAFAADEKLSVDRIPPPPDPLPADYRAKWNQGDLFAELADLDHDGRLDLILSSGDYPDPAPYDNRLRIFHQQADGSFKDVTPDSGIDHIGSTQISLADVDADGDMDLLVGQSYNRLPAERVAATNERQKSTGPRVRLFLNQASDTQPKSSITIAFVGSPREKIAYDPLGVIARLTLTQPDGSTLVQSRQLIGIGGHAGKQHQFLIHFGLAGAKHADKLEIIWPTADPLTTTIDDPAQLVPNHYVMRATRQAK